MIRVENNRKFAIAIIPFRRAVNSLSPNCLMCNAAQTDQIENEYAILSLARHTQQARTCEDARSGRLDAVDIR